MKTQHRQQLKQNEFVEGVAATTNWVREHRDLTMVITIGVLAVVFATSGWTWWRTRQANEAGEMLGVAMTIYQAPIVPPSSVPGAVQQPGSYPSEKARSEAALAAFEAVATTYGSSQAGLAARYHSAETLATLGRLNDAQQAYQTVIDKGGSSIYAKMARLGLAGTLLAEGQNDQAIKAYQDLAADRDSGIPVDGVLMQLGAAYEKLGRKAEARTTYKRVVDEFPDSPYAQTARQQMTLVG